MLQVMCWRVHPGRTILLLLFLVFLLCALQALLGLAVAHSYLACTAQTTYEMLKGQHPSATPLHIHQGRVMHSQCLYICSG